MREEDDDTRPRRPSAGLTDPYFLRNTTDVLHQRNKIICRIILMISCHCVCHRPRLNRIEQRRRQCLDRHPIHPVPHTSKRHRLHRLLQRTRRWTVLRGRLRHRLARRRLRPREADGARRRQCQRRFGCAAHADEGQAFCVEGVGFGAAVAGREAGDGAGLEARLRAVDDGVGGRGGSEGTAGADFGYEEAGVGEAFVDAGSLGADDLAGGEVVVLKTLVKMRGGSREE